MPMNGKIMRYCIVVIFKARMLEAQLRQLQIPYSVIRRHVVFARSEIKDIMSYLRLILNPEDDSAFLRIINTPKTWAWTCQP